MSVSEIGGERVLAEKLGAGQPHEAGQSAGGAAAAPWRNTILAGLANYIDAGSIVAGSAALALWVEAYNLSSTLIGVIGAFSANAISAGVGALVGGRLCERSDILIVGASQGLKSAHGVV